MDLEKTLKEARLEFLKTVKPIKYPTTVQEMKLGTVYSKEDYENSRYVKQDD